MCAVSVMQNELIHCTRFLVKSFCVVIGKYPGLTSQTLNVYLVNCLGQEHTLLPAAVFLRSLKPHLCDWTQTRLRPGQGAGGI